MCVCVGVGDTYGGVYASERESGGSGWVTHTRSPDHTQASVTWRGEGGGINVSIATTVDKQDKSHLTMHAVVNNPQEGE